MKWEDFFIVVTMPFVIITIAIMLLLQTGCVYKSRANSRLYDVDCKQCKVKMKIDIGDDYSEVDIKRK